MMTIPSIDSFGGQEPGLNLAATQLLCPQSGVAPQNADVLQTSEQTLAPVASAPTGLEELVADNQALGRALQSLVDALDTPRPAGAEAQAVPADAKSAQADSKLVSVDMTPAVEGDQDIVGSPVLPKKVVVAPIVAERPEDAVVKNLLPDMPSEKVVIVEKSVVFEARPVDASPKAVAVAFAGNATQPQSKTEAMVGNGTTGIVQPIEQLVVVEKTSIVADAKPTPEGAPVVATKTIAVEAPVADVPVPVERHAFARAETVIAPDAKNNMVFGAKSAVDVVPAVASHVVDEKPVVDATLSVAPQVVDTKPVVDGTPVAIAPPVVEGTPVAVAPQVVDAKPVVERAPVVAPQFADADVPVVDTPIVVPSPAAEVKPMVSKESPVVADDVIASYGPSDEAQSEDGAVVLQAAPMAAVPVADVMAAASVAGVDSVAPVAPISPLELNDVFIAAADAVASAIAVSPQLMRGEAGDIRVQLRPDVLEGAQVVISVDGKSMEVKFVPTMTHVADTMISNQILLQQQLAARIVGFEVTVAVEQSVATNVAASVGSTRAAFAAVNRQRKTDGRA